MTDAAPNAYAERLGIAAPRLEDVVKRPRLSYLELFVAALLERGGPLTLDEVLYAVHRVKPAEHPEILRVSLMKSWAGRPPVVKEPDGRYGIDLGSYRVDRFLRRLGLRTPPPHPSAPPLPPLPGPDVPLSKDELAIVFRDGVPVMWSGVRFAASVLDAYDRPMTPDEVRQAVVALCGHPGPPAKASRRSAVPGLVVTDEAGRLVLNRSSTDLAAVRAQARERLAAYHRELADRKQLELDVAQSRRLLEELIARQLGVSKAPKAGKQAWRGIVVAVQPRIRLTRSFDERSHSYLGFVLRVHGELDGETRDFLVAIGDGAQAKHEFRVGDEVSGVGEWVAHPDLEIADLYKASGFEVAARGPSARTSPPPTTGVPPTLEEYRARGHRRLAALTYAAKCVSCLWGAEMAVEMVIDPWKPKARKYRRETFCYGPKSCPQYAAGPTRKVPGRMGMSWEEADWVDEEATRHRGSDE